MKGLGEGLDAGCACVWGLIPSLNFRSTRENSVTPGGRRQAGRQPAPVQPNYGW